MTEKILLKYADNPDSHKIDFYISHGGYEAAKKAIFKMTPEQVREEVKKSGLRGRGGAGFPAGVKWGFIPKDTTLPHYLICNADEGEPATFKDKILLERDPHAVIEGIIISSYANDVHHAYIYMRGEFIIQAKIMQNAIDEAYQRNFLGKNIFGSNYLLDITLHRGAGSYICGEETALLSSLEGNRGNPRPRPPFPATKGLFACPTVINNVETLACIPYIIANGYEAFRKFGTEKSTGTKLFCVSGHVKNPGVFEAPLGIPLKKIIHEFAGGIKDNKKIKAVIPGGTSSGVLTAQEAEKANMDFESLMQFGVMLGSGGIVVMHEQTCMVNALLNLIRFYHHESCGQCTPCREGMGWLEKILRRMEKGEAKEQEIDLMLEICDNMIGKTICVMADAGAIPTKSFITKFRNEFEEHVRQKRCPLKK
jgi:NADH-quinone oxidoreductase subunit F